MFSALLTKIRFYHQQLTCKNTLVNQYYQAMAPLLNQSIYNTPLLAIDLEMTGLNVQHDQIISIGLIPIVNGEIILNKGQHKLIKIEGSVGQSATIHGVLDNDLDQAISLDKALTWLLQQAAGYVLVAHHAPLDMRFIEQALYQQTSQIVRLFAIDTMRIEQQRLLRKQSIINTGDLRLDCCRQRYNLPNYAAHNALVDALSCAELLLAQLNKMGEIEKITTAELMR